MPRLSLVSSSDLSHFQFVAAAGCLNEDSVVLLNRLYFCTVSLILSTLNDPEEPARLNYCKEQWRNAVIVEACPRQPNLPSPVLLA